MIVGLRRSAIMARRRMVFFFRVFEFWFCASFYSHLFFFFSLCKWILNFQEAKANKHQKQATYLDTLTLTAVGCAVPKIAAPCSSRSLLLSKLIIAAWGYSVCRLSYSLSTTHLVHEIIFLLWKFTSEKSKTLKYAHWINSIEKISF